MLQKGAETLGYEFEALAIYDLMRYVKPPIYTVCVGNAFGEAAMLLAAGEKVASRSVAVSVRRATRELDWTFLQLSCGKNATRFRPLAPAGQACRPAIRNHHASAAHVTLPADAGH